MYYQERYRPLRQAFQSGSLVFDLALKTFFLSVWAAKYPLHAGAGLIGWWLFSPRDLFSTVLVFISGSLLWEGIETLLIRYISRYYDRPLGRKLWYGLAGAHLAGGMLFGGLACAIAEAGSNLLYENPLWVLLFPYLLMANLLLKASTAGHLFALYSLSVISGAAAAFVALKRRFITF